MRKTRTRTTRTRKNNRRHTRKNLGGMKRPYTSLENEAAKSLVDLSKYPVLKTKRSSPKSRDAKRQKLLKEIISQVTSGSTK